MKLWHWHYVRERLRKFSQIMFPTCLERTPVGAEETHLQEKVTLTLWAKVVKKQWWNWGNSECKKLMLGVTMWALSVTQKTHVLDPGQWVNPASSIHSIIRGTTYILQYAVWLNWDALKLRYNRFTFNPLYLHLTSVLMRMQLVVN